jgi:hypothetical protein
MRSLLCVFRGHFYRPMHEMHRSHVRYTCDVCGTVTGWMNKRSHKIFITKHCPTWGARGSDSQGYKKEAPNNG